MCLGSGCLVQSLQPFSTGSNRLTLPGLEGDWKLLRDFGRKLEPSDPTPPWEISRQGDKPEHRWYKVQCAQTSQAGKGPAKTRKGALKVTLFNVGDRTYCDVSTGLPSGQTRYQNACLERVHTLGLVEMTNDVLDVRLADRAWFTRGATNGVFKMSHIHRFRKSMLITEQAPNWKEFLEEHGNDPSLFSTNRYFRLQRLSR